MPDETPGLWNDWLAEYHHRKAVGTLLMLAFFMAGGILRYLAAAVEARIETGPQIAEWSQERKRILWFRRLSWAAFTAAMAAASWPICW